MKRFSEQFKAKAETVKLRVAEKRDLRERLVSYMEYHPLAAGRESVTDLVQSNEFTTLKVVRLNFWRTAQYLGAGLGAVFLSLTYLAESAMPGDTLYAVKVSFNEELRSTLARTSYDKIVWETERMNRRIAEARLLASEGRLTDEVEEQVAQAVRTHSDNARKEIEQLKQVDQEEATLAAIKLTAALDVQVASMVNGEETTLNSSGKDVRAATNRIASALSDAKSSEVAATAEDLPGYDRLMARTERETLRAYELLASVKSRATKSEEADVLRRLNDIERTIAEAIENREDNEITARQTLVSALQRTQRLIVFMSNIDVRGSVTVETIVPVVRTREERVRALETEKQAVERKLFVVSEALLATSTEAALAEKAEVAFMLSKHAFASSTALMEEEGFDVESAEIKMAEAKLYVREAMKILSITVNSVLEEETNKPELPNDESPLSSTGTSSQGTTTSESIVRQDSI
jgi:hypothetical protein